MTEHHTSIKNLWLLDGHETKGLGIHSNSESLERTQGPQSELIIDFFDALQDKGWMATDVNYTDGLITEVSRGDYTIRLRNSPFNDEHRQSLVFYKNERPIIVPLPEHIRGFEYHYVPSASIGINTLFYAESKNRIPELIDIVNSCLSHVSIQKIAKYTFFGAILVSSVLLAATILISVTWGGGN